MGSETEKDKVIKEYTQMFGTYPNRMFMSASDDFIISALKKCIETGQPYKAPNRKSKY